MSTTDQIRSLYSLQVLRAIAAWMVVYHHYTQVLYDLHTSSSIGRFFSDVGNFGVDIFFVISGFIMVYTLKRDLISPAEFMVRRILRVVPVYWLMTCLFILVLHFFGTSFTSRIDWNFSSLLMSLFFIPHENPGTIGHYPLLYPGWTLNFEMFFYAWLSLTLLLFPRRWLFASVTSLLILPVLWGKAWPYSSIAHNTHLHEFALGMVIAAVYVSARQATSWVAAGLGTLFLFLGIASYALDSSDYVIRAVHDMPQLERWRNVVFHLSAAAIVCGALSLERFLCHLRALPLLKHLGDISYSTYLIHPICLSVIVHKTGVPGSLIQQIALISFYGTATLALSHLSYRYVETGPLMDRLKRATRVARKKSEDATGLDPAMRRSSPS